MMFRGYFHSVTEGIVSIEQQHVSGELPGDPIEIRCYCFM